MKKNLFSLFNFLLCMIFFSSCNIFGPSHINKNFFGRDSNKIFNLNPWLVQLGLQTSTSGGWDSSGDDYCLSVASDSDGNIYCAGITLGDLSETLGGGVDAFILKMNAQGSILWITQLGTNSFPPGGSNIGVNDRCLGVSVDSWGNVYCAGYTNGDLAEGNGGSEDLFILKLNSQGVILWGTQLGTSTRAPVGNNSGSDQCKGVSVDADGNVYCAGITNGNLGETTGGGTYDAFILKLNSSGSLLWLTHLGATTGAHGGGNTSAREECLSVSVDKLGNVYCAGFTTGDLGTEASGGGKDLFVVKLDQNGNLLWLTHFGNSTTAGGGNNSQDELCQGVAVDHEGNVFCGGSTTGDLGEVNGGVGNEDAFILKLKNDGSLDWLTHLGDVTSVPGGDTTEFDSCYGMSTDLAGNVYCAGTTEGSLGEGGANIGVNGDAFVMKLNSLGNLEWITQLGDTTGVSGGNNSSEDSCLGVHVGVRGNIYCAGSTAGNFGETNGGGGNPDLFILKLRSDGNLL